MSEQGAENRHVCLVDQTGLLSDFAEEALTGAGFAVSSVATAGDCLSRLGRDGIDAIVSSYALPDLDGLQLLRSVRVSYPTLPFILSPEDGSESLAGDAVAAGATGYVSRDDDPETVVERIRSRPHPWSETEGEQQHRYRHLIEMSPAPINVFDESGDSIWCNPALVEMLGFDDREEFIGTSVFDVIHEDDHDLARRELETVLERKESTGPTEMRLSLPGGIRYIRVSTAIGQFLGADIGQAVAVDVTDREERDRQLQVLDQWLRHNIRNEMNVIRGIAEGIQNDSVDDVTASAERITAHVDRLVEQTDHERRIIEMLSSASDGARTAVDVSEVVREEVRTARERHPDATLRIVESDSFETRAVPEFELAVRELIENGIEHNDADVPTVELSTRREPGADEGRLRVADNGPGIPKDDREYLLLDREIDQLHHGSGLGLVLVYWAVRLSGGSIQFSENEPRGSVIDLSLPARDCEGSERSRTGS